MIFGLYNSLFALILFFIFPFIVSKALFRLAVGKLQPALNFQVFDSLCSPGDSETAEL